MTESLGRIPPDGGPPPPPPGSDPEAFRSWLLGLVQPSGFTAVGVAPARLHGPDGNRLHEWLKRRYHGTMGYMAQGPDRRHDAAYILPGAQSVIMLAAPYDPPPVFVPARDQSGEAPGTHEAQPSPGAPDTHGPRIARNPVPPAPPGHVTIAAYATGEDYHLVLKQRIRDQILPALQLHWPEGAFRCITDSAPLLERAFAVRAGLGFIGKNTLHIIPGSGSFHFLAAIVTTSRLPRTPRSDRSTRTSGRLLPASPPAQAPAPLAQPGTGGSALRASVSTHQCGNCTRCLDACPTDAFVAPFILDARRCISYLTIEHRAELTPEEQSSLGTRAFGCDICQQVCPYNKHPTATLIPEFVNGHIVHREEAAETFLALTSNRQFERRFARSPLLRAGRRKVMERVRKPVR
jgi:epoxyqueuosine reductase